MAISDEEQLRGLMARYTPTFGVPNYYQSVPFGDLQWLLMRAHEAVHCDNTATLDRYVALPLSNKQWFMTIQEAAEHGKITFRKALEFGVQTIGIVKAVMLIRLRPTHTSRSTHAIYPVVSHMLRNYVEALR